MALRTVGDAPCNPATIFLVSFHLVALKPLKPHACWYVSESPGNLIVFNTAITACSSTSQWQHALNLLEDLQHLQLEKDATTYSAAILACDCACMDVIHDHCSFPHILWYQGFTHMISYDRIGLHSVNNSCYKRLYSSVVYVFIFIYR